MAKKYKSKALEALHGMMADLHEAGGVDKRSMRHFDAACLTPIHEFSAKEIRALRQREEVSQDVLAHYLNVSKDAVSRWERGKKKPAGPTLKLLSIVQRKGLKAIA